MSAKNNVDRILLTLTCILLAIGFFILVSASLGLFAAENINLISLLVRQLFLGIAGGVAVMFAVSRIPYTFWRSYALPVFIGSLILTMVTFIPGLSFSHGGATRWIDLGVITFQPVELLKIGFVIYAAGWCAYAGDKITDWRYSLLPFAIIVGLVSALLLAQPDTGSLLVIAVTAGAIFVAAGTRWLHICIAFGVSGAGLGFLAWTRPYLQERILTFLNPTANPFGSGYQVQQSLLAVGSGTSDSIFAVFAEEWGFIGAAVLLVLFTAFILRGYVIAADSPDTFSRLLVVGLISLIAVQAFVNIGGIIGLLPLSGLPLPFISHGGTALLATLTSVGIVLNVSRH
ncbi:MAG: hypothetical protein BRC25_02605 [Parcubacteria group bacterium SW_6_46_9]|nr:MAG: hypothetical protein BRC25_02605 [Parcubacteria group bacterium SW_6_46_9]